jgi:hypothetical protein
MIIATPNEHSKQSRTFFPRQNLIWSYVGSFAYISFFSDAVVFSSKSAVCTTLWTAFLQERLKEFYGLPSNVPNH